MTAQSSDSSSFDRRAFLQMFAAGVSIPAVAALTGCGDSGGGALGGGSKGGKVTELVVPTNVSPWLPAYRKVAAQYQQAKGVKITLREFPYDGLRTQMTNAIQNKNQVFDLFQLDEPWTGQFYDSGWVTPMAEIDNAFVLDSEIATYDDLLRWNAAQRTGAADGQIMGLPINGNVHLFIYRKDIYDQLGLQPPKTWEEAYANGKRAQSAAAVRYGYVARAQASTGGQSVTYEYMPVFFSYGANWFVSEGKDWNPAVNTDQARQGTEMFRKLLTLGPAQPQTIGQAEVISLMQGGQALQTHVVAAAAPQLEDTAKSRVAGKVGYAVVPAGPSGATPTSGTWTLCVPKGLPQERTRAAYDFIRWMLERQQQVDFAAANGVPTRTDVLATNYTGAQTYLNAVSQSVPKSRRAIRYVFATKFLESTEKTLSAIASGALAVPAGLERLQGELSAVVREAGFVK